MTERGASAHPLELKVYKQSQRDIRRLKLSVPSGALGALSMEVIRRLAERKADIPAEVETPSQDDIEELCHALISDDDDAAAEIIAAAHERGMLIEVIYLKYLAEAARMLGDWWDEDRVNFVQVTFGSGRMVAIMRSMRHLFPRTADEEKRSAVFATVPGESHVMGVRMATDLFRKDGWDIKLYVGLDHDELLEKLQHASVAVIGLSAGGAHTLDALSRLVLALQVSAPEKRILVSGQITDQTRELISLLGVDGIARDIAEAKDLLHKLWEQGKGCADAWQN